VVGDHRGDMVDGGKSQFVVLVAVVAVVVVEVQSVLGRGGGLFGRAR